MTKRFAYSNDKGAEREMIHQLTCSRKSSFDNHEVGYGYVWRCGAIAKLVSSS